MIVADLEDYFMINGQLHKVVGIVDNSKVLIAQTVEDYKCQHCGGSLGKQQSTFVESAPIFQHGAEPIKTIKETLK